MNKFPHRAISASAGTGKTWALTHRYLALLAAGESPDRICALTFSRKAAGEIFDAIVGRLCESILDPAERATTAANIARQAPGLTPPGEAREYMTLLRRVLDQAHRLRVGTLDSFLLGIARAFPMELGLPPDIRPMDNAGGEARALRQRLLMRLFDPRLSRTDGGRSASELLQAFRQAQFGKESKSLAQRLDRSAAESYDFYREHAEKAWGVSERIWPAGRWWETAAQAEIETARSAGYLEALRWVFGDKGRPAQLGQACAAIAGAAATHAPDRPWPRNLSESVFRQILAPARSGTPDFQLVYYKKDYPFPAGLWPPFRAALAHMFNVEVQRVLESTAGLFALLQQYDRLYREASRIEGTMSFDDFARQLGLEANQPSLHKDAIDRLYIDYRLDGRLDHWLLDEFQDTSDTQWHAIANLIDEVVQDPEQRRSFFTVGDIKQSIYGWRGGNYRLFGHVRERCGIRPGDTLNICHRSFPAVIETVNAVFDNLEQWVPRAGGGQGPHPEAVAAFMAEWERHQSARPGSGYAALLEYAPGTAKPADDPAAAGTDAEEDADPAQYEAVARLLGEVQPTAKGLSAAVLVRSNKQGRMCTDAVRRRLQGVPVVHEGTGGIVDNPVVTALLALVRYAAHPADTLALRHVQMSPWAAARKADGPQGWLDELPVRFLDQLHEQGFAGALRSWGEELLALRTAAHGDAFGRQRLNEFLAAAEMFDATGSRDCDAFDDAIRDHQIKSEAAAGTIRVMTVHQCKGLGFDMVVVPFDSDAQSFANTRGIDFLRSDHDQVLPSDDGWVLKSPPRGVLDALGGTPVAAFDAQRAQNNFSQLCVLYVAITRAKEALYLLIPDSAKRSSVAREADLLRDRLAGAADWPADSCGGLPLLYAAGDAGWFRNKPATAIRQESAAAAGIEPPVVTFAGQTVRREPSKDHAEGRSYAARQLFDVEKGDARHFGSAIHRLFERIEWIGDTDLESVIRDWRAESSEDPALLANVEAQF